MIKKIEHIALIVEDMEKSIKYYQDLFDFRLRVKGQNARREMAFLFQENMPGIEIELIRDLVPMGQYGSQSIVNHLAFTVDNIDDAINYYSQKGVSFLSEKPNIAIDGAKTIFFYGPNNELLQFVEPASKN